VNLNRLAVRERVNLLALVPLIVTIILAIPLIAMRLDHARAATETSQAATATVQTGRLIVLIQQARLLSLTYLSRPNASANDLEVKLRDVESERARLADLESVRSRPELSQAIRTAQKLQDVGAAVLARRLSDLYAVDAYSQTADALIDALHLARDTTTNSAEVTELSALDALLRSDEAASQRAATLLLAVLNPNRRSQALVAARELAVIERTAAEQFRRLSSSATIRTAALMEDSASSDRLNASENWLRQAQATRANPILAAEVLAAAQSQTQLRQLVETGVARDLVVVSQQDLRTAQWLSAGLAVTGLSVVVGIFVLSVAVVRTVSRPLRRLTNAAGIVADLAQEELLRVADEDAQEARVPRLAAIDVRTEDEIGDLATAFNRVQATAALLLERQVVSRRNVASMFSSMGRRTSNLVGRQLSLIDSLERAEEDPNTLSTLYRLDHTATRLRRNASSLVILSGGSESLGEGQPMPIGDVVRAALGTVEEYHRVVLRRMPKMWVAPGVVGDLSLLLAELLDNAVSFSPPRTQVEVLGTTVREGTCTITIIDHGMGIPPARMEEENSRLRRRERLDLAPSDVLGLFVVGRIARRHGITVYLEPTPPAGVTAVVSLPTSLIVDGRAITPDQRGGTAARQRQADAAAGATRRELAARAGRRLTGGPAPEGTPAPTAPAPTAPAPTAPAPTAPAPTAPAPTAPALTAPAPTAAANSRTPSVDRANTDEAAGSEGKLRRRVRGTNWSDSSANPSVGPSPSPSPVAEPTRTRVPSAPSVPVPPASSPPPPPGGEGIARRVPGSHLAGLDVPPSEADKATDDATLTAPDPDAVRHQVLDVEQALSRAHHVAEHGEPPASPPSVAEVASRSGLTRRVPGAALDHLDATAQPVTDHLSGRTTPENPPPKARPEIDAEELRTDLDAVNKALARAETVEDDSSIRAERQATEAAEEARQASRGREEEQRSTVEALADDAVTSHFPLVGNPAASTSPQREAAEAEQAADLLPERSAETAAPAAQPGTPLIRRVRGASLSFLDNPPARRRGRSEASTAEAREPGARRPSSTRTNFTGSPAGPVAAVPERPEEVLAWAEDLEAAMARLHDTVPGEAVPGEAVPGEAVPGEAVPGEAVPGEAVPGETVPGEMVPGETVPGEARLGAVPNGNGTTRDGATRDGATAERGDGRSRKEGEDS
jgi:signal transduction histidine kinase